MKSDSRRATPERLRASDEQFRLLVEGVQDYAIFMLDPTGRVVTWNTGAQRIKGYRAEEIIGQHFSRFYPEEDVRAGKTDLELEIADRTGRFEDEGWLIRKDGSRFWANVVITPLRDPSGTLLGFAKVTRDLSERRGAAELTRADQGRFRLLVESVEDYAIFMLDPSGRITTWNAGAQRIKGYRAEEIIGQHFSRFYPEQDVRAGKTEFELKTAAREGRFEDEGWRIRKDGTPFWANVVITALRSPAGELLGYAKVTRDLTDRRRLEEERLGRAKAEEALRLRDEFLSIASHELRSPLTALQLQLQGILYRIGKTDDEVGNQLQRASRSADRLSGLVAMLLDVSRIATGHFELHVERFDLTQLAREVVDGVQDAARVAECELRLNADHPLVGTWDRLRVEQILFNLLSNAFKYAAGSPVALSVFPHDHDAVIEVRDCGPGISERDLHRIFDRFERAHPSHQYGGMGLGLYVTRQIAEAHGGAVIAHNLPEGGACFTVRLPLAPKLQQQPAAPA